MNLAPLAAIGLDVYGVADGTPWQHVLPGCRSVVVLGNGGRRLWEAFADAVRADPALAREPHPLDTFVARRIAALAPDPTVRWVRCAADEPTAVDFRSLAVAAGIGWPSRLGLVLHPTFGPWLGLRAAAFTTAALPTTGPLPGLGPCDGCAAPCEAACPVGAVRPEGLDWRASWTFRQQDPTCRGGCLARLACPVGADHAYGPTQHRYHQDPAARASLLADLARTR